MKKIYLSVLVSLLFNSISFAQLPNPKDCSVEMWATTLLSPPTITVNWLANSTTTSYAVDRKPKNSSTWTSLAVGLTSNVVQYVDNTISVGTDYEYRVVRSGMTGTFGYLGHGYMSSGIQIPEIASRGKLILMVANTLSASLAVEIKRLQTDIEGDGWEVITNYVSPTLAVTAVKAQIVSTYTADPTNTKAVFLLGHVPVPYSGNLGPDGHADHQGAWPADVYYGEMNGSWTDVSVTSTTDSPTRTQNIPGDGKFDQSFIPTAVELQVGRVDLSSMPSFTASELQLLKNYLDKDHDYRKKIFSPIKRAVLDDNFGFFNTNVSPGFIFNGESFASSGFKNFGPLVTPTNVLVADYFTTMTGAGNSYQWSYGCGGGTYNSAGGIGATSDFSTSNLQGVFTMLFGSYFGDWDVSDNFLRAPLCQGKTLTNAWAGRPNWMFHHMAMGETIGYSTKLTQNNTTTYYPSPYPSGYGLFNVITIALMGDPTLRNDVVAPVSNVVATRIGNNCNISWSATTETAIAGYNIYMKNDTNKVYVKINPSPIAGTTYTDLCMLYPGTYTYMVRALKLENTPSGTYYNLSEGIADTSLNNKYLVVKAQFTSTVNNNTVLLTNTSSTNSSVYSWTLGNGATSNSINPSVTYTANGNYTVTLIASNGCDADTFSTVVTITAVGLNELSLSKNELNLFPNPANTQLIINNTGCESCTIIIYNNEGKQVFRQTNVSDKLKVNVSDFKSGLYLVKLVDKENRSISKKLIID